MNEDTLDQAAPSRKAQLQAIIDDMRSQKAEIRQTLERTKARRRLHNGARLSIYISLMRMAKDELRAAVQRMERAIEIIPHGFVMESYA